MRSTPSQRQSGSVLVFALLALATLGVVATLAYGTYYQIARGTQDTVLRSHTLALLAQAAQALSSRASDSDADGVEEALAGNVLLGDGWEIPATSGAPPADAWGAKIKYCVWDHGNTTASTGRLAGQSTVSADLVQFLVISAASNREMETTCSQALIGSQGDDLLRKVTVGDLNLGVGRPLYYGDPVPTWSALPSSAPVVGVIRMVLELGTPAFWDGSAWRVISPLAPQLAISADTSCSTYPAGLLARNGDLLFFCNGSLWKRVQ